MTKNVQIKGDCKGDCVSLQTHDYTNKMLTTFIHNSEVGMYVSDYHTGEILYANRKMAGYSGNKYSAEQIIGKTCWELMNTDGKGRCPWCPYKSLIDDSGNCLTAHEWEHFYPSKSIWMKNISDAIIWPDGRLAHMVTSYDITEIKEMQNHLASLAYTDQFLKLKNGIKLMQDIEEISIKPSLIIFDITSLQNINDAYGRDMGDKLLIAIRDWIIGNISNADLYRVDSDEFCLTAQETGEETILEIASRLKGRFRKPWELDNFNNVNPQMYCDISVAVIQSEFIPKNEPLMNLIERTLKTAKANKKIVIYDEKFDRAFKNSLRFEMSLKNCVREGMKGFDLCYQPIVNPNSGVWQRVEALCRWSSPEFGMVSPLDFIHEAERLALISDIGLWVVETAIKGCKELNLDKIEGFAVNVNVSAAQFSNGTLANKIANILQHYDYPAKNLCIELTESTRFTFTDHSLHTINKIRSMGINVALDDFGTGYSCFNILNKLPIDILKIERDFIINIEHEEYQQYLFKVMSELAHTLNMKVIAEGVENSRQTDILVKNGADFLQGYLFSRPFTFDELKSNRKQFYISQSERGLH